MFFSMQVVCLGSIFMFNLSKHRIRGGNVPLCNFCSLVCEGLRTTSIQRAQNSKFPGGIPGILSWRLFGIAGHGATARHLSCLRRATPCPSQRSFSDRSRGLPGRWVVAQGLCLLERLHMAPVRNYRLVDVGHVRSVASLKGWRKYFKHRTTSTATSGIGPGQGCFKIKSICKLI